MAFVPVANGVEVTMQYSQADGSFAENVFWVAGSEAWTHDALLALADNFIFWFDHDPGTGSARGFVSSDSSLVAVGARDMTTDTSAAVVESTGLPLAGTDTTAGKPPLGVTFALTSRTGLPGRSFRGRTFLIGLTDAFFSDEALNQVDATHANHIAVAYNQLIDDVNHVALPAGQIATLSVCSRVHAGVPRVSGVLTPVINYGFHDLLSDFQRRRAPGHNRHH